MFERFTDRARRVVVLAQEEARMLNHDYVGTEHILVALIREGGGVAAHALESLGITEEAARQQVEEIIGRGQQDPPRGHIPFTPRAKKTLQLSMREAIALGHAYIGTEHILLGLVRLGEGPAMQVLNGLGVDPNRVRQQVIQLVSARRVQEEPGTGRATGRGKRKLLSELRGRLDSLEWRLSVLEQRVGTAPDLGQLDQEIGQRDGRDVWAGQPCQRTADEPAPEYEGCRTRSLNLTGCDGPLLFLGVESVLGLVNPVVDDVEPARQGTERQEGQCRVPGRSRYSDGACEEQRREDGEVFSPLPRTQRAEGGWRTPTQGRPMP